MAELEGVHEPAAAQAQGGISSRDLHMFLQEERLWRSHVDERDAVDAEHCLRFVDEIGQRAKAVSVEYAAD